MTKTTFFDSIFMIMFRNHTVKKKLLKLFFQPDIELIFIYNHVVIKQMTYAAFLNIYIYICADHKSIRSVLIVGARLLGE